MKVSTYTVPKITFDGCGDMTVRKLEVSGTVQYGRILHGSSMEHARLGYSFSSFLMAVALACSNAVMQHCCSTLLWACR